MLFAALAATVAQATDSEATSSTISSLDWVIAAGIVVTSLVLARVLQALIVRFLRHGQKTATFSEVLVGRFVAAIVSLIGLVYALSVLGVRIGPLLGALGIGGVAVALALQPTLQNLFAGVVLEAQRPFKRGDEIETNDLVGIVVDITSRATVIVTLDGQRVFLPNTEVLEHPILNRVREGQRRSTVTVGVAYDTDLRRAIEVLARAITEVDGVYDSPEPSVYAARFSDSSIDFEIDVWHSPNDESRRSVVARVISAVHRALGDANITIPFPPRTLWLNDDRPADGTPDGVQAPVSTT
jgi:small conductance mechanosensitive channel